MRCSRPDRLFRLDSARRYAGAVSFALFLVAMPAPAVAEWHITPLAAVTFAGETTIIDWEEAAGEPKLTLGASFGWVGSGIFGFEGEFTYVHNFFERAEAVGLLTPELEDDVRDDIILRSRILTFSGRGIVTLPRRLTEYSLRPFVSGGVGLMKVTNIDALGPGLAPLTPVETVLPSMDIGGGVLGFFDNRRGLRLELRYFRVMGGNAEEVTLSPLAPPGHLRLTFWRLAAGFVIRY